MRKIVSLFSVLMLLCALAFAQTRTVTGIVRDAKGNPLPFSTITVAGTKNATTADVNGSYSIQVTGNQKLIVSSSGYQEQTITPEGSSANVTLSENQQLQEVVVSTALGVRKQPRELGYSVAKIGNSELTKATPVNVQNGLTGKVAGLNIATTNNGVFGDTRITLRGIRSLTGNNQPLLVLDGVPVPLSQLSRLNPEDVEDITVLKGASAAALYGPDGVNGVIYVKTQRASKSGSPQIRASNSTQFESVMFLPKFQKQFGSGSSTDPLTGIGIYDPLENQQYGDAYDGTMREVGKPFPSGTKQMNLYSYQEKGRLNFFETGTTIQNNVSYSAKNFLFSAQDANVSGTLAGDKNRRTTFRFNAGNEYGRFSTNFNISYTRQAYKVASVSPYWEVFNTAGQYDLGRYADWKNDSSSNPNYYFNEYYQNPYFIKDRSRSNGVNDDILAQVELGLKITDWLNITYRASSNLRNNDYKNTVDAFTFNNYAHNISHKNSATNDLTASVSQGGTKFNRITSDVFITAQKEFGDFSADVLVGQSFRQDVNKATAVSGANLIIPTLFNVANRTGEPGASNSSSKYRLIGAFGKLSIGFRKWAFIEVTGRNDWDSRLPQGALSFFYPGVSGSLVLTDAIPSIKSDFLSYMKLFGSLNKSGNVNLGVYSLEPSYFVAGGFPYGNLPGFQASSSVNNPAIKPEFVTSKEAGVDFSFMKSKVGLSITGYLQSNSNQILNIQTSRATGSTDALVNAANFDNKGLEFELSLTPLIKVGDFRFEFKGNLSFLDNKVNSVYQGLNEIGVGNSNYAITGLPAFVFKLTDYKRDSLGRIIVDRKTGLPSLDPNLKTFGRTLPTTIIGVSPSFGFRGLTLSVTADYRSGHQVYHAIGENMDFTGNSYRSGTNSRMRFVVPNSVYDDGSGKYVVNTDVVVQNGGYGFYEATNTNRGINTNYLTSAAAWKIREIAISYNLPKKIIASTKVIKSASLSLTGRNLFTILPKSNMWTDPEFNTGTGNAIGVNNNSILPPNRLYGFNVALVF